MNPLYQVEQAVLGSIIEDPTLAEQVFTRVVPEDFTGPHQMIASTLDEMDAFGEPISAMTLLTRLREKGLLVRVGGGAVIHTLIAARQSGAEVEILLDALADESLRRHGRSVSLRLGQRLDSAEVPPATALDEAAREIQALSDRSGPGDTLSWPEGDIDPEPAWVVPQLLAVDDRIMITGGEGLGKTMLIRQLVASVAVGMHPFSTETFEPRTALHVDLENTRWVTDSSWRHIRNGLFRAGVSVPDGTLHRLEPRHFDVGNGRDMAWLMRIIGSLRPAIVAIGPVKNMHYSDPNEERSAVAVQEALNRIRGESGAALVLEGHASYSDRETWRPRGSSSWLGWPEFGLGLKPITDFNFRAAELVSWRGARANGREWPSAIRAGMPWPWTESPDLL